uniref:Uncharacterized protein n=1 Tax=Romanomermis culicivorax TaxID=13658 RepID=A0A915K1E1_ROMCU
MVGTVVCAIKGERQRKYGINKLRHILSNEPNENGTYRELVDNFRKVYPLNGRVIKLRRRVVYGFPSKSGAGDWNFMFSPFFPKFSAGFVTSFLLFYFRICN